jgi:hypothetical protein
MKIIQSHSLINNNGSYGFHYKKKYWRLSIYVFLLSYLCLKEYYGSVTIYTDEHGYDKLIKHIPYDEIIIKENKFKDEKYLWSNYKTSVIEDIGEPFIHVDNDVFIFDDLFGDFIKSDKHDIIVQDFLDINNPLGIVDEFISENATILRENNLMLDNFEYGFYSGGVIGMKELSTIKKYSNLVNEILELYDKNILKNADKLIAAMSEEFGLYLTSLKYGFNVYPILPIKMVKKFGRFETANKVKYTHLWGQSKYNDKYIDLVKKKTINKYPEFTDLVNNIQYIKF